jgi:hypothetical protein
LGYMGATGTTSTLAFVTSECHIGGCSGQPSSYDHTSEAELSAN